MRHFRLTIAICVAAALSGLAGCAKVRYPNYYLLNVPAPSSSSRTAQLLGPIAVRQFGSPSFLREGPIVYRESAERLGFYQYDRWALDPRRAVTAAMVREIRSRGAFQSVDLYDSGAPSDWIVSGTLDRLEEVDEGVNVWIEVTVSARLKCERTGEVLWEDTSTRRVRLDERSVPGAVAAMSREVGSAVQSLVSGMMARLPQAIPAESHVRE